MNKAGIKKWLSEASAKSALFWKSLPNTIKWVGTLSAVALLFKTLVLAKIDAPYDFIWRLGGIVDNVLASIIAGFIFYLIDVHYRYVRERTIAGKNIGYSVYGMTMQYANLLMIIGMQQEECYQVKSPGNAMVNFGPNAEFLAHKCRELEFDRPRTTPIQPTPTTARADFQSVIQNRYKSLSAQIFDNPMLSGYLDPALYRGLTQLTFNVNWLLGCMNRNVTHDELCCCIRGIGITSGELYKLISDDPFYSLGFGQPVDGRDLYPPVNRPPA